ncbi:hypothetical protein OBBRIDRAFT_826696 [Obba rivulosa]|uniref:F-box domain-containing protein n=1 Tax=Obba rivulosa TaxID=1052685 RepID=A0A8E2DJD7_9APHY|nr:hypothetical protein OBBRIDRAFT_826696 [Obba rivulosa]
MAMSLPDKLLEVIFEEVRDGILKEIGSRNTWIRVSHICRCWWDVALAYEPLWSDVRLHHGLTPVGLEFVQACYERAPRVNISIDVFARKVLDAALITDFMELVKTHAERIVEFKARDLRRSQQTRGQTVTYGGALDTQPEQFKDLTIICLENVRTPWQWPQDLFSTVQELRLSRHDQGRLPTMTELPDMLEACPSLAALTLSRTSPEFLL